MRLLAILSMLTFAASMHGADALRLRYTRQDPHFGETTGHGTAFAIAPRKVITAAHNLLHEGKLIGNVRIEVGERWLECKVLRYSQEADIAVLSVSEDLDYCELGDDPHEDTGVTLWGSLHGDPIRCRTGIVTAPYKAGLRFLASASEFGHGMSGGPVKQGKHIVGMMVAGVPKDGDMDAKQCYFVPASALRYFAEAK